MNKKLINIENKPDKNITEISKEKLTIELGDFTFKVLVKADITSAENLRINDAGIVLYSGLHRTKKYIDIVAASKKIDPIESLAPAWPQPEIMYKTLEFREILIKCGILWIPFIVDTRDKRSNVPYTKYFFARGRNPYMFWHFCLDGMGAGECFETSADRYRDDCAIVYGLKNKKNTG